MRGIKHQEKSSVEAKNWRCLEEKLTELKRYLPSGSRLSLEETPDLSRFVKCAQRRNITIDGVEAIHNGCGCENTTNEQVNKCRLYTSNSVGIELPFQLTIDSVRGIYFMLPLFSFKGSYLFYNSPIHVPGPGTAAEEREMSWALTASLKLKMEDGTGEEKLYEVACAAEEGAYETQMGFKTGKWAGLLEFDSGDLLNMLLEFLAERNYNNLFDSFRLIDSFIFSCREETDIVYTVSLAIGVDIVGSGGCAIDLCAADYGFYGQDILVLPPAWQTGSLGQEKTPAVNFAAKAS